MAPPAGCVVQPLAYGTTTAGSIVNSDCTRPTGSSKAKYYTFQAFLGQEINITMTAGRFASGGLRTPLIRLYGPGSGFVIGAGANVVVDAPSITRRLSCAGTYGLEATSLVDQGSSQPGLDTSI